MKNKRFIISILVAVIVVAFINFYPLPYYVSRPGMAKVLDEVIEVDGGNGAKGNFMLTTVWMGKANIISYVMANLNKYYEIDPINTIRYEDETDEEYSVRQLYLMEESQENALQIAFKKAGKEIEVKYYGIYVLGVKEEAPADGKLKPGDRITKVDGKSFESSEQFMNYVQSKQVGDSIEITYIRENKVFVEGIVLEELPELGKPGIGISLVEDKEVYTNPKVNINTDEIGGPSAGLMFSLEIYNQLVGEDITKGYEIAGTGTITSDGKVGPIGGIEQKIVAADKSGAEIFFAPNENGRKKSNYQDALKTAKDIDTTMKIVPVDTIDDAIAYLQALEPKK